MVPCDAALAWYKGFEGQAVVEHTRLDPFASDGQVSVNISQGDYFAFRDDFDFDQLCRSLADIFIEFLGMYRKGQETRIMDRLDAMKIGVFS